MRSSSTPSPIEARRQRISHLQPSPGQSGLHVCFSETEDLCSFVDTEVLNVPQDQYRAVFLGKRFEGFGECLTKLALLQRL